MSDFKKGDKVKFRAGPRSTSDTTAEVIANKDDKGFLTTKDGTGVERRVRPGSCSPA